MAKRETTKPFTLFFLLLPYGISTGFASITLPFFLTRAGFSVASAAAIVALGVSSNVWLFCWAYCRSYIDATTLVSTRCGRRRRHTFSSRHHSVSTERRRDPQRHGLSFPNRGQLRGPADGRVNGVHRSGRFQRARSRLVPGRQSRR